MESAAQMTNSPPPELGFVTPPKGSRRPAADLDAVDTCTPASDCKLTILQVMAQTQGAKGMLEDPALLMPPLPGKEQWTSSDLTPESSGEGQCALVFRRMQESKASNAEEKREKIEEWQRQVDAAKRAGWPDAVQQQMQEQLDQLRAEYKSAKALEEQLKAPAVVAPEASADVAPEGPADVAPEAKKKRQRRTKEEIGSQQTAKVENVQPQGISPWLRELYEVLTKVTDDTAVQYVKGAKNEKNFRKSYQRYNVYAEATTLGQAFALGSTKQDAWWDFMSGNVKVVGGPLLEEPLPFSRKKTLSAAAAFSISAQHRLKEELPAPLTNYWADKAPKSPGTPASVPVPATLGA